MKFRFTNHDTYCMVKELIDNNLEGSFVDNIYDINNKIIVIKFNVIEGNTRVKKHVLLKSGELFYLMNSNKFKATTSQPSSFVKKLRKHINNKKLINLEQVNYDRVVIFHFTSFKIILEMYGKGNIIITDDSSKILHLLHPFEYKGHENEKVKTGNIYPYHLATMNKNVFKICQNKDKLLEELNKTNFEQPLDKTLMETSLRVYGSQLIKHSLLSLKIKPAEKKSQEEVSNLLDALVRELEKVRLSTPIKGYYNQKGFYAFPYLNVLDEEYNVVSSFSEAIDIFFEQKPIKKYKSSNKTPKIEGMKKGLIKQMDNQKVKISWLEAFIEHYENHIDEYRQMLISLKNNKYYNNKNLITIAEINKKNKTVSVNYNDIYILDYTLDGYANLSKLYDQLKKYKRKMETTKNLYDNTNLLAITKNKKKITPPDTFIEKRKEHWYEKYKWFISSENHLVILGRNSTQNEEIVKKHMEKCEVWFHSDVPGSGSAVIKGIENPSISESHEVATYLMSHTHAWNQESPNNVIFTKGENVYKTENLAKGSFHIKGKVQMIKHPKMELGLTVLFKLKDINNFVSEITKEQEKLLEYAIPMLAPYSVINKNKFRIKILHGRGKGGKILKNTIIPTFLSHATLLEKYTISKIPNELLQKSIIQNIRIVESYKKLQKK